MTPLARRAAVAAPTEIGPGARALVERIGDTPLLPLPSPSQGVRILGKAEWLNPGGSAKDRTAWSILRGALEREELRGRRLLDASSGNTAIAYAMLGAALDVGVTICLPENASRERRLTLAAYGAEFVETDAVEGTDGAIEEARRLADEAPDRFWYADQYANDDNWLAHYRGTGPEIWRQTEGEVTHLVAGIGTGGTIVGCARRLRELDPGPRVVAVEPAEAMHGLEGLKHLPTARVPPIYDAEVPDELRRVATERALEAATELARRAGLFVGPSAGAAYAAAREVASELERGTVVTVLPDGGGRYLDEAWWTEERR